MRQWNHKILRAFHAIVGIPGSEGFEHSFFNAVSAVSGVFGLLLGSVKYFMGIGAVSWIVFGFGLVMCALYYLSRFRKIHRPLRWPAIFLYLGILAAYWLLNGGADGGTPFYFFVGGLVSLFLVNGPQRKTLVVLLYMLTSGALLYIETQFPHWITGPALEETRRNYFLFSFLASQLVLYLMLILISGNFEEVLSALGQYHNTFEEDLVLARTVQEQVLQYSPEVTGDFDFDLVHRPSAELSGDVYDLSRPDPTFLRVLLADARGHGINAALISMLIKSEYLNANSRSMSPGLLMNRLNLRIFERYDESLSLSAIVVDIYNNRMVYSSGGHVPQFLVGDGEILTLEADGPPLGLFRTAEYAERECKFGPGHRLFLFTDALTEETDLNGRPVGEEWLHDLIRRGVTAKNHTRGIIETLADLKGQTVEKLDCQDDLTLIVIGTDD